VDVVGRREPGPAAQRRADAQALEDGGRHGEPDEREPEQDRQDVEAEEDRRGHEDDQAGDEGGA